MELKYKITLKSFLIGVVIASLIEFILPLFISGGCYILWKFRMPTEQLENVWKHCGYNTLFGITGFIIITLIITVTSLIILYKKNK